MSAIKAEMDALGDKMIMSIRREFGLPLMLARPGIGQGAPTQGATSPVPTSRGTGDTRPLNFRLHRKPERSDPNWTEWLIEEQLTQRYDYRIPDALFNPSLADEIEQLYDLADEVNRLQCIGPTVLIHRAIDDYADQLYRLARLSKS